MRVSQADAQKIIREGVRVTHQDVVVAKSYILQHLQAETEEMLRQFLGHFEAQRPSRLALYASPVLEPQLKQAAKYISWQMAFTEGLWGLMNATILMPAQEYRYTIKVDLDWTTVAPGSGGASGTWRFDEYMVCLPKRVVLAPSWLHRDAQTLSDSDLYLADLGIPDLHPEVREALSDAVECFRHDLYVPCLAMLAKASEGAWTELGLSLLSVDPGNQRLSSKTRSKYRDILAGADASIAKKIRTVVDLYSNQDVYGQVKRQSGIAPSVLEEAAIWANVVRDSRNAVHYGVEPSTRNSYEKVAALLLGAAQNLRAIYKVYAAACSTADSHQSVTDDLS